MAKVFVSYSRKDITFAKRLTAELQKCELDFWIDWEGIPPTVDWWKEIQKGIEEADIFLFLISPDSAKSKICGQEIDVAVKNGKRIIPIVVREIEWQDTPPQLGHLNYIFFSRDDDFDTATKKLIHAIQTDYEWAATHRRLQVKALEWKRNSKEGGFLLRSKDLLDAETNLARNSSKEPHPTDLQREYVLQSRKATDRQRRLLTGVSVVGVIALAALAVFGFYQANIATKKARLAQSQVLAITSNVNRNQILESLDQGNPAHLAELTQNLLLAAESLRLVKDNPRTERIFAEQTLRDSIDLIDRVSLSDVIINTPENTKDKTNFIAFHQSYYLKPDLYIHDIKMSPDSKWLAVSSYSDILLYDVSEILDTDLKNIAEKPMTQIKEPKSIINPLDSIYSISFSLDGKWLAASGCEGKENSSFVFECTQGIVAIWNLNELSTDPIFLKDPAYIMEKVVFTPDSKLLVIAGCPLDDDLCTQGLLLTWEMNDPTKNSIHSTVISPGVFDLALSPDSHWIATIGCAEKEDIYGDGNHYCTHRVTMLWNLKNSAISSTLINGVDWPVSLTFAPDGQWLAVGGCNTLADGTNRRSIVNLHNMKQPATDVISLQSPAGNCIYAVAVSPSGDLLATNYVSASENGVADSGNVQLWEVNNLSASPLNLHNVFVDNYDSETLSLFSPNGEWLVIGKDDLVQIIRLDHEDLLNAACHVAGRNFTPDEWSLYLPRDDYRKTCEQWPLESATTSTPTP